MNALSDPLARLEGLLSAAVSRLLLADDERARRLARLDGTVIELCVRDTRWRAFALPSASGIRLHREYDGKVDVRVIGRPGDFLAYARASRRGDSLGAGRIEISGDLAVAQNVQSLLADLDIDWEDLLAPLIGDVGAHQLARAARAAMTFLGDNAARFETDIADYLHHESGLAPTREETDVQRRAVFSITDDVDRLEARLARLLRGARR